VIRTVASEGRGIDALATTIDKFREPFCGEQERELKYVGVLEEAAGGDGVVAGD